MTEEIKPVTTPNETGDATLLDNAGKEDNQNPAGDGSILDQASKEQEAKVTAENERILKADPKSLSTEELAKRSELEKANEDAAKAKADAEKAKAVPEKYTVTVPEGMTINQEMLDKITPVFKELGITQTGADKLIGFYTAQLQSEATLQKANFDKYVEDSKKETIASLGANYKEELAYAAKARDMFASPELIEKLNGSGLANDKDMLSLLIKVGKIVSEDKLVDGKAASAVSNPADKMFPSSAKK